METTEEEKYSSPVRTRGRNQTARPPENKAVIEANEAEIEVHDGDDVVEASESMEIVLHISEDEGDKTDVEAGDAILLDGKMGVS